MERKEIKVNWNSLESIQKAENEKEEYENKGYTLFSENHGLNLSTYIYINKNRR